MTGKNDVPNDWKLQVLGEHNRENAGYAVSACRVLGVSEDTIREGIEHFVPVSGRLESLGEKGGVLYINDTTSTTPDSLIASLRAFPEKKGKIVLIAGGADKGLIVDAIFPEMQEWCKGVVWLPGSGTEKNMSEIKKLSKESFFVQNMQEAVNTAQMHAEKGDVIVLSPGFASFGIFKNEYDRGDQFTECVRKII
jgi:UDP-N-acetylmuramoylalanine--D-glutamate ligase